jgi:3-phenylpropionate/cinnamic acid dioxygenase small subunit
MRDPLWTACDAVSGLIFTYAERIDAGDLAGVAALFADATYRSVQGGSYRGQAAVLEVLSRAVILHADGTPRTKHVTTNLLIDTDEAAGTAAARSYFTVLQATDRLPLQTIVAGRYHDRFVHGAGGWRFDDRLIFMDLIGDLSQHLRAAPAAPPLRVPR